MPTESKLDLDKIQSSALGNPGPKNIGELISNILPYIFGAAGIALLIYLVLGGFQLMLSRGDPKAIDGAKAEITNAIIGFVIIIIAFFVVQLIGNLFNIQNASFTGVFK